MRGFGVTGDVEPAGRYHEERKVRDGARYSFDSMRSGIWVSGRSSLHPINTETRGDRRMVRDLHP